MTIGFSNPRVVGDHTMQEQFQENSGGENLIGVI